MCFLCDYRNDGLAGNSINLPTEHPFTLLRYGTQCQSVYGMTVTDLFIHWADVNDSTLPARSGAHPEDSGIINDHSIHICYYSSDDTAIVSAIG